MASAIPENRAAFTAQEILTITGGAPLAGGEARCAGVATDTRGELSGRAFVALAGERFDGHVFCQQAVDAGAAILLVERPVPVSGAAAVIQVASTLRALGDLAAAHRARWSGRLVAVAGSVGKTTTRSMTTELVRATGTKLHSPPGNLNNLVGAPMVLLGLEPAHEAAVVELGTSLPGEVRRLTELARPDVAILTRISLEHSEGLGDIEEIQREEGALLRELAEAAAAVVNGDDPRCVEELAASRVRRRAYFGQGGAEPRAGARAPDCRIVSCRLCAAGATRVELERAGARLEVESPLVGLPGAYALSAAWLATEALLGRALRPAEVRAALRSPSLGEPGRLRLVPLADGSLVVDDSYNSSPASARSSVQVASQLAAERGARLVLALGEMRELGALSRREHEALGRELAVGARPAALFAYGGDACFLAEAFEAAGGGSATFCADPTQVEPALLSAHRPGDVVLVKSSRGLRAERLVSLLVSRLGRAT